jgi:hypothetical protein
MSYEEIKKDIKDCVRRSLSNSNIIPFESLNSVFLSYFDRPSSNILELRKRNNKNKGTVFEVFCSMYLEAKGYKCWMLSDIPEDVLKYVNLTYKDLGVDLLAAFKIPNKEDIIENYFYFPVQVKYRKETKDYLGRTVHRVGWKDISTFLSLVERTGPSKYGWKKHIIMTNADNVSWKGNKGKKDWTIAKKSFKKCERAIWYKIVGMSEGYSLKSIKEEFEEDSEEEIEELPLVKSSKNLKYKKSERVLKEEIEEKEICLVNQSNNLSARELRQKWLDNLKN